MSLVLNVEILGEFKKLTQATKGAETQLGKLNKSTQKIGNSINGTLAAIGVGFSLGAVIRGINDTLESASDLEQQFGALDSIFKDLAPSMKNFAATLAPIGLSSADASRSMALLGSQLKGYGLPVDEAAKKTQELTLLAADLAATFGGTTYGAVQSISALFRGEYDPIEKYGVAIKKSDVNARLAAQGLSELEGEALKQAEAQAALELLFLKTADAQGQAARESESYASQQAYLKAETENLKAEIGEALLPVMVELFKEIRDNLPEIKAFISQMIELIPIVVDLAMKTFEYKEIILQLTIALAAIKVAAALAAGLQGLGALNLAFANPYFLGAAAVIGAIALAYNTLTQSANQARDAVNALNKAKQAEQSTGGYSLAPAPDVYEPYAYKVPTTPSSGIAGQSTGVSAIRDTQVVRESTTVNVNINRATVNADEVVDVINSKLKSQGSTLVLR